MNIIYTGEEKVITITVKDDDGVLINLSGYDKIQAAWIDQNNNIVQKYARDVEAGFDSSNFSQLNQTTNKGQFTLTFTDTLTKVAVLGGFGIEVKAFILNVITEDFRVKEVGGKRLEIKDFRLKNTT